jgi:hypothetical protein
VCEQRDVPYLLRLRKTANVKRLIERKRSGKSSFKPIAELTTLRP